MTNRKGFKETIQSISFFNNIVTRLIYKCIISLFKLFAYLFKGQYKDFGRKMRKYLSLPFNCFIIAISKKRILKKLTSSIAGKKVIIFPPTLEWNINLFQRPQQLATAYSKKNNFAVLYLTQNVHYDFVLIAKEVSQNLWVFNDKLIKHLRKILSSASETIISLSWTQNLRYIDSIKPKKVIYEYIDELEIFDKYGPDMERDHIYLMKTADLTVCTASKLYEKAKEYSKNAILSPNAGDFNLFSMTSKTQISSLIRGKLEGYNCVLGYYGALAKWFDYKIVAEVALERPDWVWLLIGYDYDNTLVPSGILKIPNIIYIPAQPYKTLPTFLKAFNIATVPFVINDITLSTSPVKVFEYMAAGKPIVSSRLPECMKYRSVCTYSNVGEFIAQIESLQKRNENDPYWQILKQEALDNTWDARTDGILQELYRVR